MKKPVDPDKPKYNPTLVCQICGYTGHSARHGKQLSLREDIVCDELSRGKQDPTPGPKATTTTIEPNGSS